MIALHKDPEGEQIFSNSAMKTSVIAYQSQDGDKIASLQQKVKKLEAELEGTAYAQQYVQYNVWYKDNKLFQQFSHATLFVCREKV